MRYEKKLAPEMKVISKVRDRMRGSCLRRFGNIGYGANQASQTRKAMMSAAPMSKGARTWAECHGYYRISRQSQHSHEG